MFDGRGGKIASADGGTEGVEMGMEEGPGGDFVETGNDPRGDCGGSVLEGPGVGGLREGGGWVGGTPGVALLFVGAVGREMTARGASICRFTCRRLILYTECVLESLGDADEADDTRRAKPINKMRMNLLHMLGPLVVRVPVRAVPR